MGPKTSTTDRAGISPAWAKRILLAFVFVGLLLRVGVALQLPRIAHPDEIFQTQEPAHRLAYGYGVVSWEWRDGVRS
jgi:phosphatidylinositol glycan class B